MQLLPRRQLMKRAKKMKSTWHKNSQHETVESRRRKKKHSAQAVVVCTVHITGANSQYIIIAIVSLSFAYCVCVCGCVCAPKWAIARMQKHTTHSSRTPHIFKCLLNGEMETKRRRNAINYNFFDFNSLDSLIYHAVWFGMVVVVHGKTSIGPARWCLCFVTIFMPLCIN